jgi:O-antigen ligase
MMFLLLLIVPISNVANMQMDAAWDSLNEFLTVFLLFFIIVNLTDTFEKFKAVCWTLIACTTMLAINGIVQRLRGVDLVGTLPVEGNRITYLSHFGDPNDLALVFVTFLPFILVNLFEKDISRPKKLILLMVAVTMITALYFTNSRGGYIAFLVMLVYFAVTMWGWLKGAAMGAFLFGAAIVFAPSRMANISMYERSAGGRVEAWTAGLVMLKSRPIFGVGYKYFGEHHERAAHSAFVHCLGELGLVGYFVWLALLYTCFVGLKELERSETFTPYRKYSRILKLSLIGFLASAFFLSMTYSPVLYILLALITLTINNRDSGLRFSRFLTMRDLITVAALIVISIISFKILAMVYF